MTISSPFPGFDGLMTLSRREGVDIRPTLLRVLTDLYVQAAAHSPDEKRQFVELTSRLIDEVDDATRAAVRARLSIYPDTPSEILGKLALKPANPDMPIPLAAVAEGVLSDDEVARIQSKSAQLAADKLERLVHPVGIPESRRHLIARHPTDAIEQVAAETGSALLVMGAISRSGLRRLLIGNTAEKVLDHLSSDLLIIKPPGLIRQPPPARRPLRYSLFKRAPAVY